MDAVTVAELQEMAEPFAGELVKGVVDVAKGTLILDMELHVDGEQLLLSEGSRQANLWGINLRPQSFGTDEFVEFDSTINVRPRQENRSRYVEDAAIREQILQIVAKVVSS